MVEVGKYNLLKVIRAVDFGVYLDDGAEGILLPKRFVPTATSIGDELKVFYTMMAKTGLLLQRSNQKVYWMIL